MRIPIQLPLYCLFLYACSRESGKEVHQEIAANDSTTIVEVGYQSILDTIPEHEKTLQEIDTIFSTATPVITPLPFGPQIENVNLLFKKSFDFYYELIGKNIVGGIPVFTPTYRLPTIAKVKYIAIDSAEESNVCYRNIPIDSLFKINKYRYRLPDLGSMEIYYMSNDTRRVNDFTVAFKRYCSGLIYQFYGYLILYKRESMEAKVLTIFYLDYVDAVSTREFYIDTDYKVYLSDKMYSEGEGKAEQSIGPAYEITIAGNGEVEIKKLMGFK